MKIKRSEKYLVVIKTDGIESEMSANEIHKWIYKVNRKKINKKHKNKTENE